MKKWIILNNEKAYVYEGTPKDDNSNLTIVDEKDLNLNEVPQDTIIMDIEIYKALF